MRSRAWGEEEEEQEEEDGRTGGGGEIEREKGWKGKQFRPEISIKAKRRKSAPPVTVNFSSGLHLTAA